MQLLMASKRKQITCICNMRMKCKIEERKYRKGGRNKSNQDPNDDNETTVISGLEAMASIMLYCIVMFQNFAY